MGGRRLGVRWSLPGLDAELRSLAAGALGVQDAPANLSIVLGESRGRSRTKHQLYVQGQLSGMISGDSGLIRAVIRGLGTLAFDPPSESLSLSAVLVMNPDNTAVAVDGKLVHDLRRLGPVLRRSGRRVLQLPHLDVRPEHAIAVLPDAAAAVGVSLEVLDARWPLERGGDDLAAGAVVLTRFVYGGRPDPPTRADAVADIVPMLREATGRVKREDVAQLVALTGHLPLECVLIGDRARLAAVLGLS